MIRDGSVWAGYQLESRNTGKIGVGSRFAVAVVL